MMPTHEDHGTTTSTALDPPDTFGGRSIADILDAEHHDLERLAAQLRTAGPDPDRRRELASVLVAALSRHISAERQDLLPAVRSNVPGGPDIVQAELEGDARLLSDLGDLDRTDPGTRGFGLAAERVAAELQRHVTRSGLMLPPLRGAIDHDRQVRLGNRIALDNEVAPTRAHTWTPASPPWNRIVDPLVGAVDKVLDAATGRRVYPSELTGTDRMGE